MNIVLPMAGRGSRLSAMGVPKPLIQVQGKPLLAWSTHWLARFPNASITVIGLQDHERDFNLIETVTRHIPSASCLLLPAVTEGQLCTVLNAADRLNLDAQLLIAPCDTMIEGALPVPASLCPSTTAEITGIISVASMPGDRWSFAKCDHDWTVSAVAEKTRISNWASSGLYYFSNTRKFLDDARRAISSDERIKGEFYIMPLYGRMLKRGDLIKAVPVSAMHDLGTPEALAVFESKLANREINFEV